MFKKFLIVWGGLLMTSSLCATELPIDQSLSEKIQNNVAIIVYMKDVIKLPNQGEIIESLMHARDIVKSPQNDLNYADLSQKLWDHHYWIPKRIKFQNKLLQDLLGQYQPVLSSEDHYHIFLANILYDAGLRFYQAHQVPDFLEHAASLGHAQAQYHMYRIKISSSKTRQEAENYLFSAAAQQSPEALRTLSRVYRGGVLMKPQDYEIAHALCEAAAQQGDHEAQFCLEVATYTEGYLGGKIDYQKGIRHLKQLVESGNSSAIQCLDAIMQSSGDALMEGNEHMTYDDLDFLREFLGWKDEWDD